MDLKLTFLVVFIIASFTLLEVKAQDVIDTCADRTKYPHWWFSNRVHCGDSLIDADLPPLDGLELDDGSTGFFYIYRNIAPNTITARYPDEEHVQITLKYYSTLDLEVVNVRTPDGCPGIIASVGTGWTTRTIEMAVQGVDVVFQLDLSSSDYEKDFFLLDKITVTFEPGETKLAARSVSECRITAPPTPIATSEGITTPGAPSTTGEITTLGVPSTTDVTVTECPICPSSSSYPPPFSTTEDPHIDEFIDTCVDRTKYDNWGFHARVQCFESLPEAEEELPLDGLDLNYPNITGLFYVNKNINSHFFAIYPIRIYQDSSVLITLSYYSTRDLEVVNVITPDGRPGIIKSLGNTWTTRTLEVEQRGQLVLFLIDFTEFDTESDFFLLDKISVSFGPNVNPVSQ